MTPDQTCPTCPRPDELEHAEALIAELRAEVSRLEALALNLQACAHSMEADRDLARMAYHGLRDKYRAIRAAGSVLVRSAWTDSEGVTHYDVDGYRESVDALEVPE